MRRDRVRGRDSVRADRHGGRSARPRGGVEGSSVLLPAADRHVHPRAPGAALGATHLCAGRPGAQRSRRRRAYLSQRGESRPRPTRASRADAALRAFLSVVFAERSDFHFDGIGSRRPTASSSRPLYEGRAVTTVVAPLLGARARPRHHRDADSARVLARSAATSLDDAPPDAVWGDGEEPNVLIVLTVAQDREAPAPVSVARVRFRRTLTALRLFERGGYALGPIAWTRIDAGAWRPVPLGGSGRPRTDPAYRRRAGGRAAGVLQPGRATGAAQDGEIAWALARFEMGCERLAPFEALTDYLLALRALLEPEGPASGRLAGRLAAICATPEDRAAMAERTAHAISLERAVIGGLAPAQPGRRRAGRRAGRTAAGAAQRRALRPPRVAPVRCRR